MAGSGKNPIFVIGFIGMSAIVDRWLLRGHRNSSAEELLQAGFNGVAFRAALQANDQETLQKIAGLYGLGNNEIVLNLKRLFGFPEFSENINFIKI